MKLFVENEVAILVYVHRTLKPDKNLWPAAAAMTGEKFAKLEEGDWLAGYLVNLLFC